VRALFVALILINACNLNGNKRRHKERDTSDKNSANQKQVHHSYAAAFPTRLSYSSKLTHNAATDAE